MNKVELSEILDIARYEKGRDAYRRRVIALKRNRRLPVGPRVTFVFENHDTVLFQVQEMMRAERIVNDDAIQHEIDTYNQLLPGENELAATMLIELPDPARIRDEITKFHGVNTGEATYLQIGDGRLPGVFDAGQSDELRISAVQYVRFRFNDAQREAFVTGANEARLVINHPNYHHEASITGVVRDELAKDLF
ncbi:MAG TPA: DUF3501 family protein [Blastocatellia bacterium]|jgi:hypothetical protein|nr:DUF3501 family protein [Blastocatellia bacterium]